MLHGNSNHEESRFWFMDYAHVHLTSSSLDKGGEHCPTASHTCWVTYALYSEFSCLHEY